MNLKFPLLNLISRGHLPLTNQTASLNFVKTLDEGPATKLCYEMLKYDNLKDMSVFLEQAQNIFQDEINSIPSVLGNDRDFRHQRDNILLRESDDSKDRDIIGTGQARQFIQLMRNGGIAVAIGWFATRTAAQKNEITRTLKNIYPAVYSQLQNNWIGRNVVGMPNDKGELLKRVAKSAVGMKKSNGESWMTPSDHARINSYFGNIGKKVGTAALIAGSVTGAIVAISLVYKQYFSQEAKACNGTFGKQRTICMIKARIAAAEAAIKEAEKGLLECSSAKNEEECIFKMKVELRAWKKKKRAEEEKLIKLNNVNKDAFEDESESNDPFK